ncbi:helix-turn-helix domain-containing protein [Gordonia humi]
MPERLYTVAEAAEHLGISPVTVKRYIRTGMLSSVKLGHQRRVGESGSSCLMSKTPRMKSRAYPAQASTTSFAGTPVAWSYFSGWTYERTPTPPEGTTRGNCDRRGPTTWHHERSGASVPGSWGVVIGDSRGTDNCLRPTWRVSWPPRQ